VAESRDNPARFVSLATLFGQAMKADDPKARESAALPEDIAVLQAYIDLINSERETIWARHNALLVANSLIIGALAISPTALWGKEWAALGMIGAGLLISAAWLGITLQGWSAMERHADRARAFTSAHFKHLPNALDETLCDRAQTHIHHLILLVIVVFMLMYFGLGYIRFSLA
jgi:hypothetical protein